MPCMEMPWKEKFIVTWAPLQLDFHFQLWPLAPSRSLVPRRQSFQNLGLDNRAARTKEKRSDPCWSPPRNTTECRTNLHVSSSTVRAAEVLRHGFKHCNNHTISIAGQPSFSHPKYPAPFCLQYTLHLYDKLLFSELSPKLFHLGFTTIQLKFYHIHDTHQPTVINFCFWTPLVLPFLH